jgi:WS/DGAT/MGAT family acyltransferase
LSSERVSAADISFLYLETRETPQHLGSLALFRSPVGGLDYDRLVRLLEERISLAPRFRQKLRGVPGHIANPVWVDDPSFDITYHVRRSALRGPGGDAELLDFCASIQSRLLDRSRPLWEMYLIEGLPDDRVAIVTKTHHSMVDGHGAVELAQVLLDDSPDPARLIEKLWMPEPEPSGAALLTNALIGMARRPAAASDSVRLGVNDVRATAGRLNGVLAGALSAGTALLSRAPASPLSVTVGQQRRIAVARTRLEDYRAVRHAHATSVNDVVLATVAGAIRAWWLQRGEAVTPLTSIRALVPVSVNDVDNARSIDGAGSGSRVAGLLVDLPVGEPDPVRRLMATAEAMSAHRGSGRAVNADALVALSGFAPPTLHALGARAANGLARRMFNLVVTNVPGPQQPRFAAGARMTEMFPILPLSAGQAMSIGLISYDGGVFYGINGDRDAMPDLAVLAGLIEESIAELVAASPALHAEPPAPAPAPTPPAPAPRGSLTAARTVQRRGSRRGTTRQTGEPPG